MRHPVRGFAVVAACIAVSLFCVFAPSSANAQNAQAAPGPEITLMGINSLDPTNVVVVNRWTGNAADLAGTKAEENGKPVTIASPQKPILQANLRSGVMFMMDTSQSTDASGTLTAGRNAAKAMMQALPQGTEFGVVAAGTDSQVVQPLTKDQAAVTKALNSLTPSGDGGLWGGVASAANQFTGESDLYGSIVFFTDGNDGTGGVSYNDAKGAVLEAGVPVYTLAVNGGKLTTEPRTLSQESGGTYSQTDNATDLAKMSSDIVPSVGGLYVFSYQSNNRQGVTDLFVTVGNSTVKSSFVAGSDARGVGSLVYLPSDGGSGFSPLQNDAGKYLAILLGLVAAGFAAWAIISIAVKDQSGLASVLQPYSGGYVAQPEDDADDEAAQGMAQTAIMQRAVELTEQFAERQGFLTRVEAALERANLPLRAAEAIFFYVATVVVIVLLTAVVTRSPVPVLIILIAAGFVPPAALNFMTSRRTRQFETQLPDTLQLLSGTLRAGYSMMQGVEAVSQEVEEPMGRELRRVVTEARLGRPLEEALDSVAERMGSPDFAWAVMAIRIQREVGGNLSELLMTVAETMTQRERLRRDIKALTAEGRMSAYVLAVMPPALALAMYVINPDYMEPLWTETAGKIMLLVGLGLMVAGFVWMQKIVKIEV
jgi:tight adherence protein B